MHLFRVIACLALVGPLPSCGRSQTTSGPTPEPSPGSAAIEPVAPAPAPPPPSPPSPPSIDEPPREGPALPLERIAIVGASISAGFGGTPFGEAFAAAAPRSQVDAAASTFLFRDPIGDTKRQLEQARAFKPTTIVALDLLFWDVYGSADRAWHERALESALAQLESLRAEGVWILVGDIPLITTASELLLPKAAIPSQELLDAANAAIRSFATRERVLLVPLTAWTDPLRAGASVTLRGGESVPAASLMAIDGLHANPLGVWYLLDKLDLYIEEKLPGTPRGALVFQRPAAP